MGLDMYLSAKRRLYPHHDIEAHAKIDATGVLPKINDNLDYIEVSREAAYWRKANQIHNWFVTHVQRGNDDCGHYYVSRDHVQASTLVPGNVHNGSSFTPKTGWQDIVECGQVVLNSALAEELLPTASGFFFGSTEYNEWYIDDLKNTIEQLDKCLALPDDVEFEYHSSW
jgi:hypothetical protein